MKASLTAIFLLLAAPPAVAGDRYDRSLEQAVKRIVAETFAAGLREGYEPGEAPHLVRPPSRETTASIPPGGWVDGLAPAREWVIQPPGAI